MVDTPSSYNTILVRPILSSLQVVASPYHQKIKFPMGNEVGKVRGDQQAAQKGYVETIRAKKKGVAPKRLLGRTYHPMGAIYWIQGGELVSLAKPDIEVISIVLAYPERTGRIAWDLPIELKALLICCLI